MSAVRADFLRLNVTIVAVLVSHCMVFRRVKILHREQCQMTNCIISNINSLIKIIKTNTSDFSEQILSEIDSIADQRNGKRSIRSSFS